MLRDSRGNRLASLVVPVKDGRKKPEPVLDITPVCGSATLTARKNDLGTGS
jgi:hypothetical protein